MSNTVRGRQFVFSIAFFVAFVASIVACAAESSTPQGGNPAPLAAGGATSAEAGEDPSAKVDGSVPAVPRGQSAGIRGKALRGPVMPGPQVGDDPGWAPLQATFFVNDADGNEVARFESDEEGAFELLLAPGDYVIVPEPSAPVFRPAEQPHAVTVPEGEIVELVLRYDTGIR